ncbi:MAG: ribonuclease R [candidate division Zixibacteria bacterium]|nr:ribonuclease R [candidate division Zixibacteria bacterium]
MNLDAILEFVRRKADRPMKMKELADALSISPEDYTKFRRKIKQLLDSGDLVKLKKNRIGLASELNIVTGRIVITRGGLGFIEQGEGKQDIMVTEGGLHTALDRDRVMVRLGSVRAGRQTATVIKVVERSGRNIVGVFFRGRSFSFVRPDNPRFHRDLFIPSEATLKARNGEKVVARFVAWDDPHLNPEGKVVERLGVPGKPGVDMLTVIRSHNLADKFEPNIIEEAEEAAARSYGSEKARRHDFTADCIYTIDPADAKDHDDAISVERTDEGYRLGVHIADVSHFVRPGTDLDREAFTRGNSTYLPGMVIPMLPEILSNDVCSLKVNRTRLTNSALIDFDNKGDMVKWRRFDGIIKSKAKLSYEQVEDYFNGNDAAVRSKKVRANLLVARELATLLAKRRFAQGSLDFDLPEASIILDESGEVLELGSKVRMESHRLVEEFMLVANRAMALEVFRAGQKMLYRVHDRPDDEKLHDFSSLVARFGHRFSVSKNVRPIDLAHFLEKVKDTPEADLINELMLRSMKKAVYQGENIGHFGLAFSHYTHFTSPIRRYPDLLVHRLLRHLKNGRYPVQFAKRAGSVISTVGNHCSETERASEVAEREAVKIKQVAYMARHVGDEFEGVISGMIGYGFFVRLDRLGVEGMVRVSTIDDDYYHFDEKRYQLVGRRKRHVFQLGDRIKVGVLKVDQELHEIDLFPVAQRAKTSGKTPKMSGGRKKKR